MRTPLFITLILAITAFPTHAQSDRQLVDRYDQSVNAERYQSALVNAQKIVDRYPESATWNFNLGSMHARLGQTEHALQALSAAADLGYTGVRSFEQSEDLDSLREEKEFQKILSRIQLNAAKRLRAFTQEAQRHTPKSFIPQNAPESPALILALHGTGMRGNDMIKALQESAEQVNMILIAPDALRPAQDGGFSWTYRDESEWMVQHMIQSAIKKHNIDPDQIYLVGFSQGANIALTMAQTHPELFAGIIPICGHYEPQIAESNKEQNAAPVYLMTGARDPWKKTYATAKRDFLKANTPAKVRVIPAIGHQIPAGPRGAKEIVNAIKWCQNNQPKDQPNMTQTDPITTQDSDDSAKTDQP